MYLEILKYINLVLKYLTIRPIWKKLFWFIVWCLIQILTPVWYFIRDHSDFTFIFFYFEEVFYIFAFFIGFIFLLFRLLSCEIIWPTQSFNKRHKYFSNNYSQLSFLENLLKLTDTCFDFISFEFLFFFAHHLNCEVTPTGYEVYWW